MSVVQESCPSIKTTRPRLALATFAAVAALAGGCRSGAQSDIVEREMRQQEDQIYALQDDLSNYQQLVCQYRSENEALKQQLAECPTAKTTPAAKPAVNNDAGRSRLKQSPQTPIPPSIKSKGPQLGEPETPPGVPKLELGEPEVPPLKDSSAIESPIFHFVSYEAAADYSEDAASTPQNTAEPRKSLIATDLPEQVVLRGQIVRDEGAAGPRILAHVEPRLSSGQPVAFRGPMSLMVLDPNREGHAASIARWDFGTEDLGQAAVRTAEGTTLEFPLQLPPEAPTDRPVELWARLLRVDGQKLLAHATIDLSRPGQFCSAVPTSLPTVAHTVQIVDSSAPSAETPAAVVRKTDWQVARPDGPLNQVTNQNEARSEWRTATQPIPFVPPAVERIASPQPVISSPARPKSTFRTEPAEKRPTQIAPDWSPERTEHAATAVPVWSPLR
jgi:hypothetical protein